MYSNQWFLVHVMLGFCSRCSYMKCFCYFSKYTNHQILSVWSVMEWLRRIEEQFCWWGFNTEPELCCFLFQTLTCFSRWWQLKYFCYVHPETWGRWTHFDEHIFSDGLVQPLTRFVFFVDVFECWFILAICPPRAPFRIHLDVCTLGSHFSNETLEVFNVGVRF